VSAPPYPEPGPNDDVHAGDAYAGAVDHYTSPSRRDWVKRVWEEPELVRLLDTAIRHTGATAGPTAGPTTRATTGATAGATAVPTTGATAVLDVLDVGCGAGVALELLRATPTISAPDGPTVRYLGVDLDADLLTVAESRFGDALTRFSRADIRDGLPGVPHDLYLSTGVPYSHLTRDELADVVTGALAAAARHPRPTVLVIDVLGRYSLEWTTRWDRTRWDYRMSFFATDRDVTSTPMSTYGGEELEGLLSAAADAAHCHLDRITLVDRSIVVGRHTATGEYTPGLRNYRQLVNDLADTDTLVDLHELRLADLPLLDCPTPVRAFFEGFAARWDARLTTASAAAAGVSDARVAAELQPALARELLRLELESQPGLGVGHSLTATVVTAPRG
jgi:SAM-dependent methyltransferase